MKIRNRLLITHTLMAVFPLTLILCCTNFILRNQGKQYQEQYHITSPDYRCMDYLLKPLKFYCQATASDYRTLTERLKKSPGQFQSSTYLKTYDEKLADRNSSLLVLRGNTLVYGNEEDLPDILYLPQTKKDSEGGSPIFLQRDGKCLVRMRAFTFPDGAPGYAFLIADFSRLDQEWMAPLEHLLFYLCIILLAAVFLVTVWTYQSIIRPLNILQLAATQLGNGMLGKSIPVSGDDELGLLCASFENMRIRLKHMMDWKFDTEDSLQEILGNLSHDLKTPITAIKGYTEGILDGVANTPEKQLRYLQTIYAKANDISYLIDQLSIYAKIEQNAMAYHFISVNLDEYFKDCIEYFSLDLERDHISIDYQNNTSPATQVIIDPMQLRRVIQNLIGNAVKYNDKQDGRILIRITDAPDHHRDIPARESVDTAFTPKGRQADLIRVEIEDNGAGIALENLPHIFDKFYRVDAARNTVRRGSGLGLAIVKMIIADHGGSVGADSIQGQGSRFYFTLRKDPQEEEENE